MTTQQIGITFAFSASASALKQLTSPIKDFIQERNIVKKTFGTVRALQARSGKVKYALAMWLLGLPLPIVLIALFWGGCDW